MASAAKLFKAGYTVKADKYQMVTSLAAVFLNKGIVKIRAGADIEHLERNDVSKIKHFRFVCIINLYICIFIHVYVYVNIVA